VAGFVAARLRLNMSRRGLWCVIDPIQAQALCGQAGGVDLRVAIGCC
jgi:hypothetical protein